MNVDLSITNRTNAAVNLRRFTLRLRRLLKILRIRRGSWSIAIVSNSEMARLHKSSMSIAGPTDVLTFDMREGERGELDLETVLCRGVAAPHASEFGHSVDDELLLYALHSLLHVQGYDDKTAAQAARMHRREDALLIRLGLGPVFNSVNRRESQPRRKRHP